MSAHVESGRDPAKPADSADSEPARGRPASRHPRVYLHIGEPKTGTTFIQQILWRNRGELAAQGVLLPGHHPHDHFRAQQDLRGIEKLDNDPGAAWEGEWDVLAAQAREADSISIISHELICATDEAEIAHVVRSLQPAEVHVVSSVRDMATLLPAEWQETIKHRNTRSWEDWLSDVIDNEAEAQDRRQFWFWRVHDTLAILQLWARHIPRENIHVITRPPSGSDAALLWQRFAQVIGAGSHDVDVTRAGSNAGLGVAETEYLRRLNAALSDEVPSWFYMWNVKETLAHRTLAARPKSGRLVLPAERDPWVKDQAEQLISGLRAGGFDIVGSPDELMPPPASGPGMRPSEVTAEQMLDASVESAAALVLHQFRRAYPAVRPTKRSAGLAGKVEAVAASSPAVTRTVRRLSNKYPAVRKLRVAFWRWLERTRARSEARARKRQQS